MQIHSKDVHHMHRLDIKPLSVNEAWRGRRFRTGKYVDWREEMLWLLPKIDVPDGKLNVHLVFGFSNKNADIDGPIKGTLDALQERYGFNDRQVYWLTVEKKITLKADEFIKFSITSCEEE